MAVSNIKTNLGLLIGKLAPGMSYLMVITPGYEIILEAGGELFSYHAELDGKFVLCGEEEENN